ncbi:MAG: hypothetical protein HY675_19475 [Chloroflexi bacterium]|nr:hypothetical protein [Chloroflexota bacterium]
MVKQAWVYLALVSAALLLAQCAPAGSLARPTAVPPAPTALTTSPTAAPSAQSILAESVRKLNDAESYKFSITASLLAPFEGKQREWKYKGEGAAARPDKYQWTLEGQADVFFKVVGVGDQVSCADTRGERRDCSLANGGPRPGSSPYTVIAYLKNFAQVGEATTKSIGGADFDHLTFVPSLPKVSSLDTGHGRALSGVTGVTGEVWIDRQSRLPHQEKTVIRSKAQPSGEDVVEMTLVFADYGRPVDIRTSR